jgi:predicted transcriptional regulator
MAKPKADTVKDDQKVFSVRLSPELIRRVKVHAVLADRSVRSVVEQALKEFLERYRNDRSDR